MTVHKYEVVKQYVFWVEGLSHTVKARITRNLDPGETRPFTWEISHHYKPSAGAGVYYPSEVSALTIEVAKRLLFMYAEMFTNIGVTPNQNY